MAPDKQGPADMYVCVCMYICAKAFRGAVAWIPPLPKTHVLGFVELAISDIGWHWLTSARIRSEFV